MAKANNHKKFVASAIALITAATLLVGGTFAWQSISQYGVNIVTTAVNPGGRLHDDFDGSSDKNIYVENYGTQNIYARLKLSEYLEIGQNAGDTSFEGRSTYLQDGTIEILAGEDINDTDTYTTYYYDEDNLSDKTNASDEYWTKEWAGGTLYIPTFNMNQDSLAPDLNGTYEYIDENGEADPYGDYVDINATYNAGDTIEGTEIADADTNDSDEGADAVEDVNITSAKAVHTVSESINGQVISMEDYKALTAEEKAALNAWVYDVDGWAYWSQPIAPKTSTGLLLSGVQDLGLIDEDYYYAIHVIGQFITADDLGKDDNTGFYSGGDEEEPDKDDPSKDALELLESIGVNNEVLIGGRLHDDFNGTDKDVYMENYGEEAIYVRVHLSEYMEVGPGAGNFDAEDRNASSVIEGASYSDKSTWSVPSWNSESDTLDTCFSEYWTWTVGNSEAKYFMPTFNKNINSFEADINGSYHGTDNTDKIYYDDYVVYGIDGEGNVTSLTGNACYGNEDEDSIRYVEETHQVQLTGTATVMTMETWESYGEQSGNYWVYDEDGWAYWMQPVEPGAATGLLLDNIEMSKNPGEKCYYAINVKAQFIPLRDVEAEDNPTEFDWPDDSQEAMNEAVVDINLGGR